MVEQTPDELGDEWLAAVADELRRGEAQDAGAAARVMAAIRRAAAAPRRSPARSRRSLMTWMPLAGGFAAATAAVVVWTAVSGAGSGEAAPAARGRDPTSGELVQFVIVAPQAERVSLVGSFNDWDPQANPLERVGAADVWSTQVPLAPGRHEYAFKVDDTWMTDEAAPTAAGQEFGTPNSVIVVRSEGRGL